MTHAVGSQGVIEDRYNEFLAFQSNGDELRVAKWVEHVYKKKEGLLHACGAVLGDESERRLRN